MKIKAAKFIKPEITVKELSLHALLGENGWLGQGNSLLDKNSLLAWATPV